MVINMDKSIFDDIKEDFPKLNESITCDILIVGGGLTGLSLAYYLKDENISTILIEQGKLASSTTRRSTAKLTYFQQDILSKIVKARNKSDAYLYYKAQKEAISRVTDIIKKEDISCHLEKSPSYLYVREEKNKKKLKNEIKLYKDFRANVEYCSNLPLKSGEVMCAKAEDNYVFNPTEYAEGLIKAISNSKNVSLYEKTRMIELDKKDGSYIVNLENKKQIFAKKIVFAGHYPPFVFPYLFPATNYLEKDFVCADKHEHMEFNAINLDKDLLSIRFYEDYIIKVVKSAKLSNSSIDINPYEKEDYPYKWINYDIMTQDSLPIIGKIKNNLYIATGYNTWGMTNSNFAGYLLKDILLGKDNRYKKLVNPKRFPTIMTIMNGIIDNASMIINFIGSYLPLVDKPTITIENGKRVGIVMDKEGKLHKVSLTCPHMKCGLKFNRLTKTWDCPCHGSRFDIDGNLLRGPSTKCVSKAINK